MAKSISTTLLAAQQSMTQTPYIHLLFTSANGGTTYDYSSDQSSRRILLIDHTEEPYSDTATIVLRDNDKAIPDLKGYWTEIGYGFVTGIGNEYPGSGGDNGAYASPRLWVKHQQSVSSGGSYISRLELEGMWNKAAETLIRLGSNPIQYKQYTATSIKDIISALMTECGFTLNTLVEDDTIISGLQPNFEINNQPFEFAAAIIYRLICMTKSYLRPKALLQYEVKYPQSSDAVNLNYYLDQHQYFYEYTERANTLIPNHVYAFGYEGADGLWTNLITGEASDSAEIAAYADVTQLALAGDITAQADINARAAVVLARARQEALAGRMIAPHDCRLELYDRISVLDSRGV